jgi:AraC family transcriptional regulator
MELKPLHGGPRTPGGDAAPSRSPVARQFPHMVKTRQDPAEPIEPLWQAPGIEVEKRRSWRAVSAHVIRRAGGEGLRRNAEHRLSVALTPLRRFTVQIDEGPTRQFVAPFSRLSFYPAGATARTHVESVTAIEIFQAPQSYHDLGVEIARHGPVPLEPLFDFDDPLMIQIAEAIAKEIDGRLGDRLLVDTLNVALAIQIARRFVDGAAVTLPNADSMSRGRLSRVLDYIEAHVDKELKLAEIAAVACLSPYHFSCSFKRAMGVSLHRYVVRRRVERAKELVLRTDLALAEIAVACGFNSQALFTTRFRQHVGLPPGRLRKDR